MFKRVTKLHLHRDKKLAHFTKDLCFADFRKMNRCYLIYIIQSKQLFQKQSLLFHFWLFAESFNYTNLPWIYKMEGQD